MYVCLLAVVITTLTWKACSCSSAPAADPARNARHKTVAINTLSNTAEIEIGLLVILIINKLY